MTDHQHRDELAPRRAAKRQAARARPMTVVEALEQADSLLCGLVGIATGELLVDAQEVLEAARRADELVIGVLTHEREEAR